MKCKFKQFEVGCTLPFCYVTEGECQFVKDDFDFMCPIQHAYENLQIVSKDTTDNNKSKN